MVFESHYPILLFRHLMFRRMIRSLAKAGLELGKNVTIMPGVEFDATYPFLISIGDGSAVSSGVRIIAHDASIYPYLGITRIGRVLIRENCLIGEKSSMHSSSPRCRGAAPRTATVFRSWTRPARTRTVQAAWTSPT